MHVHVWKLICFCIVQHFNSNSILQQSGKKYLKSYLVYFLPTIVVVVLAQNMLQSHTTRVRYASYIVSFDFALSLITFGEFYEMRLKMMAKKVFVCLIQLPHIFAIKLSVHTPPHHSSSDPIDQKMMIACLQQMAVCECVCRCIYKAHDTRLLTVQFSMLYRNSPYHPAIFQ